MWSVLSGSVAVVRSYVASATNEKERIWALSGASAAQSLGFMIGPGEQPLCIGRGGGGRGKRRKKDKKSRRGRRIM